jgi:Patatin-like phospholipase
VTSEVPTYGVRRGEMLCMSGGGFRAALFHLGALTRLNELGLLAQTETVGAVAGGSILAALLAARVHWPLQGAFREWPEAVAAPMRSISQRNARARALLRSPLSGVAATAALEERYARELVGEGEQAGPEQPRFVFGGAGLALAEIGGEESGRVGLRWAIEDSVDPGYDQALVADVIATVRTDLDAFGEAERAVLENHGYLLADAAVRAARPGGTAIEPLPPEPPHPHWMNERRVREALAASSRRTRVGRLRPRRPGRPGSGARAASGEVTAMLERHRPIIQYDSLESYRADSVASIVSLTMGRRCNSLHRADGTLIAAALPGAEAAGGVLDLDFLGPSLYANGMEARNDDYLDESGGRHAEDALAMRRRQDCADVTYGRACRDEKERLWLQYWLFYYYNDKGFLKAGLHEGDWEMVQLLLGEDGRPQAATYGQHSAGTRARWSEVERRHTEDGEAPVVYCARGSHAALLRAGTQKAPVVPDHNDGLGPAVRPRLVVIGEEAPGWAGWPGYWGSTRRREAFEGDSPRGPALQPQWWNPAEFHREAKPADEVPGWQADPVPAPQLSARREDRYAIVSYRFGRQIPAGSRPERIVAAPYGVEAPDPPRTQTFSVEGEEGTVALQLPPQSEYEGVRVSVASELGAPGETLAARFVN